MVVRKTFKLTLTEDSVVQNEWEVIVVDEYNEADEDDYENFDLTFTVNELRKGAREEMKLGIDDEVAKELLIAFGKDW